MLELLVVLVMMGILTSALVYAFVGGLDLERRQAQRQSEQSPAARVERRITRLLEGALLSEDTNDLTTYFVAATEVGDGALGADRLTFTTVAVGLSLATQQSSDDFETQHEQVGSQGGVAEVSLGIAPVGEEATSSTGLFERLQQPADGDEEQGGTESVLEPAVTQLGFEFYDGTQWVADWDTKNNIRRLPAAVRVSYTLATDSDGQMHSFVVVLLSSDVDADNPATDTSTGGAA